MNNKNNWPFFPNNLSRKLISQGYIRPTPVQKSTISPILMGKSLAVTAPAGSGKTLAYLSPFLKLAGQKLILVIAPTRELVFQINQMLSKICEKNTISRSIITSGKKIHFAQQGFIIGTPGRLLEATEKKIMPSRIDVCVLDEYDKLIDMGFHDQVKEILDSLSNTPQLLLFSATKADFKTNSICRDRNLLEVEVGSGHLPTRTEEKIYYLKSEKKKKDILLEQLTTGKGNVLVFVNNRKKASHLKGLLKLHKISSVCLHGGMDNPSRARIFQKMREGLVSLVIATDLAGRGLDALEINLVINYDLPRTGKEYLHRKGRAGRAGKTGLCISLAGPDDYLTHRSIEKELGKSIEPHPAFSRKDLWLENARRFHQVKVDREKRLADLRRKQGLQRLE